jgi:CheY-like chemotaxis protein
MLLDVQERLMARDLIVIVDDDEEIRASLADLLEDEGYDTVSFADGMQALRYLDNGGRKPRLILLDLMMPVMDGWQFRKEQKLRPALSNIPVAVITAAGRSHLGAIDVDDVLPKPLNLESILQAIERHPSPL